MLKNSLLWELIPPESDAISFLFGTMHVKDEIAYQHINRVIAKLSWCDALMCEIDLDKAQTGIPPTTYLIPNGSLSSLLTPHKYEKYRRVMLKTYKIDLNHYQHLYPLVIFNKISEALLSNDRGVSLDSYLWNQAKKLKLETSGIEDLHDHVSLIGKLDMDVQLKMLKSVIKNTGTFKRSLHKITQLYAGERIQTLYKYTKASMGSFREPLIYNRNRIMAEKIYENQNQKSFYAVGAAHLAGNKGVLRLLKQMKYKLKPI